MAFSYPTYIFILPDESKLLTFDSQGINLKDTDGSNPSGITTGFFESHYMYDETTGFIYVLERDTGNLYRNTTAFDFTTMSNQGNIVTGGSFSTPRIIKVNNSRYLISSGQELKYTDDAFSSLTSITPPEETSLIELLYEGENNVMSIYNDNINTQNVYRSTNNGLNWTLQFTENSVIFGPGFKI